jgi:membrane-bound lytic murein transglycosylase B
MKIRSSFRSHIRPFYITAALSALMLVFAGYLFLLVPVIHAADACSSDTEGKSQAQLTKDLEACNAEIAKWTDVLNSTKKDSASFARDVAALTAKINAAQASIKAKNIAIANLGKNINDKQAKIISLDQRIETGRNTLAELIRKTNEIDSYSVAEAMLSNKNLSDFFVDVDTYAATERSLEDVFAELRGNKTETEKEKEALNKQREAEANAKALIESAKKQVEKSQAEKAELLAESKAKEKSYSQVLADRQAKANQIRSALFSLRDTGAIPFGTALQYAEEASRTTGVRPALVLAILTQESNLGQNVGSCVITDLSTGATRNVNTGKVYPNGIHPTRDLPILQTVLKGLGKDPLTTKVSCPLSIGYGGGMGPAQFIPSTWILFAKRIQAATGVPVANPWNAHDAFFASSMYLGDLGASAQTYAAEKNAACRYYSGKSCAAGPGASYGAQVMAKADLIQTTMIDPLQGL